MASEGLQGDEEWTGSHPLARCLGAAATFLPLFFPPSLVLTLIEKAGLSGTGRSFRCVSVWQLPDYQLRLITQSTCLSQDRRATAVPEEGDDSDCEIAFWSLTSSTSLGG